MNIRTRYYSATFLIPACVIYFVFFLFPTVIGFYYSFTDLDIQRNTPERFVGFDNFRYLFQDSGFKLAVSNTVKFAVVTLVFKTAFGLGLAILVNSNLKVRHYLRTIFYLPTILSMIVVGIMFSSVFQYEGLLNNFLSEIGLSRWIMDWTGDVRSALGTTMVLEIWKWSGMTMAIFLSGLQSIPKDYYEAAYIDGAGPWSRFRHVTLPLLTPSMNVVVTLSLIGGFRVFDSIYVLTRGGPGNRTEVINTLVFKEFGQGLYGRGSAMTLMLVAVIAIISLSLSAYFKRKELEL